MPSKAQSLDATRNWDYRYPAQQTARPLVDLINKKRAGQPIAKRDRPVAGNVVDLMEALRRSLGGAPAQQKTAKKSGRKPRKASSGQNEMLMPIAGKKQAKETAAKKTTSKPQRKSA
jgi:DNA end-binding protein Ku